MNTPTTMALNGHICKNIVLVYAPVLSFHSFCGSLLQTPVLNSTAPRMNGVERKTVSMAVCVTRTRPDQILLVKVISLQKL